MSHPLQNDRAIYSAMSGKMACLAEAASLAGLKQIFIKDNESTQDYCPKITSICLNIDDMKIELPDDMVADFINDLEKSTNFLTWEDEDYRRMQREESY